MRMNNYGNFAHIIENEEVKKIPPKYYKEIFNTINEFNLDNS